MLGYYIKVASLLKLCTVKSKNSDTWLLASYYQLVWPCMHVATYYKCFRVQHSEVDWKLGLEVLMICQQLFLYSLYR